MLRRAKERKAKEQAQLERSRRPEKRSFRDRAALHVFLVQMLAETDAAKRPDYVSLSADTESALLNVNRLGGHYSLNIPLESRSLPTLTGYPLERRPLPSDAISDLPLNFELPTARRDALARLAQTPGVRSAIHASNSVSPFETESFHRYQQFSVQADARPDALTLIEQILDILWPTPPGEIRAQLQFPVNH